MCFVGEPDCFLSLIVGLLLPTIQIGIKSELLGGTCKKLALVRHGFKIPCPLELKENGEDLANVQMVKRLCRGTLDNSAPQEANKHELLS